MISDDEFKNLCHLARLDAKDASLSNLKNDFNRILEYVNKINEIDTSAIDDHYSMDMTRDATRADIAKDTLTPKIISGFAPAWESGHFVVPAVIDAE